MLTLCVSPHVKTVSPRVKTVSKSVFVAWVYFSLDTVFDTNESYDGEDAVDAASLLSGKT